MNRIRIFVVSSQSMFGRGIESLLREETTLDIVGQETDINRAIERIGRLRPDVVIVDHDESDLEIAHILRVSPNIKVIGLSLQNNNLYVYQARQRITRSVEDLLQAMTSS